MMKFHPRTQNILSKLILMLLIGVFALWGIGDIFRTGGGIGSVASVGGTDITAADFGRALQQRKEQMRQAMGASYNPEMLKRMGLEQQVLGNLVNHLAIKKEAASLGIVAGDEAVRNVIAAEPAFRKADGGFDQARYRQLLQANNLTEATFVESIRDDLTSRLLMDTVTADTTPAEDRVRAMYLAREQRRTADLRLIPASAVKADLPTDAEVKEYYDKHHFRFTAPETRTVEYVRFDGKEAASGVKPSDSDIAQAYREHLQDFRTPERRAVEQLIFDAKKDADKAAAALKAGQSFAHVAADSDASNKSKTTLGDVTREQMPAEARDAVFALKAGGATAPLQTAFGWNVFHVSQILPENTKTFEDAKASIAKDLAVRQAQDAAYKQVTAVEDALSAGANLKQATAKLGVTAATFGPMQKNGTGPDGRTLDLPPYPAFLPAAFSVAEQAHSQTQRTADGSYFILAVDNVTPAHIKPFSEVSAEAAKTVAEMKHAEKVRQIGGQVADALRSGKPTAAIFAAYHLQDTPLSSGPLTRGSESPASGPLASVALPHGLLVELFGLAKGGTTHAMTLENGDGIVATLTAIQPASLPKGDAAKQLDPLREEAKNAMREDLQHGYLLYLRGKYPLKINQQALLPSPGMPTDEGE